MTKEEYFFQETNKHIRNVQLLMCEIIGDLLWRQRLHDVSKFDDDERFAFQDVMPELGKVPYGSEEYKALLQKIRPAIDRHNRLNFHHPENHISGIHGMTLMDLLEMLCDWIAASKRNPGGDVIDSIKKNQNRFGYGDELSRILENTANHFYPASLLLEEHDKFVDR